jgi:phenylacetate-coenzyme A ligase PaaK-like adenylate-forming protein
LTQQLADPEQFEVVVSRLLRQAPPFVDFLTGLICAIAPDRTLPQSLDAIMRHLLI